MKTLLLSIACVTGLATSASAQVFQPQTARNILIGGVAGAIIGENNDRPVEGALIGAAAGALWSAATVPARGNNHTPTVPPRPVYHSAPSHGVYEFVPQTRHVVMAAPYCEPPRRTVIVRSPAVIVHRPVVVAPYCPPPRVVIRHHHHRDVHRHHGAVHRPHRGGHSHHRGVYLNPGYRSGRR